jgi:BirA family biotin operon repressor/biotin-[acetyl-CoA-carboxylase] ligase
MGSGAQSAISAEALLSRLRTREFGREMRVLAETESTIDVAWQWLHGGGAHGGVVIAERQTAGRGRQGRPWASPPGGLWMSVLARPNMDAVNVGRLGIALALAAAEAVSIEGGLSAGVRWPNDVVVGDRKVGGVLVETELVGDEVRAAVLSLGLNVNVSVGDLPAPVQGLATSLQRETRSEHSIGRLAAGVLEKLEQLWPIVVEGALEDRSDPLAAMWRERDVLEGHPVAVEIGAETVNGTAIGIDRAGNLVLMIGGAARAVSAGEAALVRKAA